VHSGLFITILLLVETEHLQQLNLLFPLLFVLLLACGSSLHTTNLPSYNYHQFKGHFKTIHMHLHFLVLSFLQFWDSDFLLFRYFL
jgi:hypothetical protein